MAWATKLGIALLVALASNATLLSVVLTRSVPDTSTTTTLTTGLPLADEADSTPTAAYFSALHSNNEDDDDENNYVGDIRDKDDDDDDNNGKNRDSNDGDNDEINDVSNIKSSKPAQLKQRGNGGSSSKRRQDSKPTTKSAAAPRNSKDKISSQKKRKPLNNNAGKNRKRQPGSGGLPQDGFSGDEPGMRRRGDIKIEQEYEAPYLGRGERSTLRTVGTRMDTGHHLADVIASLTEGELEELPSSVRKVLIPALVALESVVLRELERLHDISVHHDLRVEQLEKRQLQEEEIVEAANVIREESYLKQRSEQKEALKKQQTQDDDKPSSNSPQNGTKSSQVEEIPGASMGDVLDFEHVNLEVLEGDDGSGSGDEPIGTDLMATAATAIGGAPTAAAAVATSVNITQSSDSAIINHIYEIYSSITSMEHKVMEVGTSLGHIQSEVYRQRGAFVRLEDKVEEIRRDQRNLVMRSTMHGFKLTDMEQFKGQAELVLRTAESSMEQFEAKLEIFKDRVTEQSDLMDTMRNTFSRLEQFSTELRAADAYKAHDIQELKRGAQQIESRVTNLYHSLDTYIGNIRWDVKTYLDHLCSNNNLNCRNG